MPYMQRQDPCDRHLAILEQAPRLLQAIPLVRSLRNVLYHFGRIRQGLLRAEGIHKGDLMDAWEIFSELCKKVVEEQNVYLDVFISSGEIEMMLMPWEEDDDD